MPPPDRLPRTLGSASVVGLTLSALSPAASVCVTGSAILHTAGTGAVAAVAIGGLVILIASLLYAEIGSAFPAAGGAYPGIGVILGPAAARVAIVLALVTSPALLAFVSLGLADYVRVFAPLLPKAAIAPAFLLAACLIASMNLKVSARVAFILLTLELLALAILIWVGAAHPVRGLATVLLHPQTIDAAGALVPTPIPMLLVSIASGAFACAGSSLALYFAEDLDGRPQRIGGLVTITGLLTVLLVTTPLVFVATGARDLAAVLRADVPIAAMMTDHAGRAFTAATLGTVVLAIFNNLIASMMAFGRFLYATGVDGIWPPPIGDRLGRLHARSGSPVTAIGALFVAALIACLVGQRSLLALLSAEIFTALLIVFAVVVGRRRRLTGVDTFRSPLFPLSPVIGLCVILAFAAIDWQDRDHARVAVLILGAVALLTYGVTARRHRPPDARGGAARRSSGKARAEK